jgi:serine/threonine-protein kinase
MRAPVQVIGQYAIYDKIASGGMAGVHFGRQMGAVGFARTVAVKRLHPHLAEEPEFAGAMIDEARLAARIHHPNVVTTLDVVATAGEVLVVMEYVRGESLSGLLRRTAGRQVPLPIASAIVVGALYGLHAAHEATNDRGAPLEIVHRDVSPQNILVGVDGLARIIDFGVAKAAGRLQETTREGIIKGKIAYMAPEQLAADEVTRAVDVYAMGVVLWELLAGRRLFDTGAQVQLVHQVLKGPVDGPGRHAPNVTPELDALVMRALARQSTARFSTAKEMADAIRRIVPPAFPDDVGRWVEEVAGEGLARRLDQLAEIESHSDVIQVPDREGRESRIIGSAAAASLVAPEPSSVSVETRTDAKVSRRVRHGLFGAIVVVAALATTGLVWTGRPMPPSSNGGQTPSAAPPAPDERAPDPGPSTPWLPAPAATPTGPPAPTTSASAPPPATRRRVTPKPAASIRFAQPD